MAACSFLCFFFPLLCLFMFYSTFSPLLCGKHGPLSFLFLFLYQLPCLSLIWKFIVGNSYFLPLFLLCLKELAIFHKKLCMSLAFPNMSICIC